jgi:hypothetical protein
VTLVYVAVNTVIVSGKYWMIVRFMKSNGPRGYKFRNQEKKI